MFSYLLSPINRRVGLQDKLELSLRRWMMGKTSLQPAKLRSKGLWDLVLRARKIQALAGLHRHIGQPKASARLLEFFSTQIIGCLPSENPTKASYNTPLRLNVLRVTELPKLNEGPPSTDL